MIQRIFDAEENLSHARGTEWNEYQAGTDSGATATHSAETWIKHKIFWVSGWSDTAGLLQIKDGATVIWEVKITADNPHHFSFPVPLIGSAGNSVSAVISASTSDCHVAFGGFSDKNI